MGIFQRDRQTVMDGDDVLDLIEEVITDQNYNVLRRHQQGNNFAVQFEPENQSGVMAIHFSRPVDQDQPQMVALVTDELVDSEHSANDRFSEQELRGVIANLLHDNEGKLRT
jgi:hypothetical protein